MGDVRSAGEFTVRERKVSTVWTQMDKLHSERGFTDEPGFTIIEYSQRYHLTRDGSHGRLQKLVQEGKLIAGWAQRDGKRVRVYRFPEN